MVFNAWMDVGKEGRNSFLKHGWLNQALCMRDGISKRRNGYLARGQNSEGVRPKLNLSNSEAEKRLNNVQHQNMVSVQLITEFPELPVSESKSFVNKAFTKLNQELKNNDKAVN